jgi:hypothetical protein
VTTSADRIRELVAGGRSLGLPLGRGLGQGTLAIESALGHVLEALRGGPTTTSVTDALALLGVGTELEAAPDLWATQNEVARLWGEGSEREREVLAPLMAALGFGPDAFAAPRGQE